MFGVSCKANGGPSPLGRGPAQCAVLRVRFPGPIGSCSPVCPLGVLPVCAVSCATWLLFTGLPARRAVLHLQCPRPLVSCSPVGPLSVLRCVCGVLGHLAPVYRRARSVRCFTCAVSLVTGLLTTGVPIPCVVLLARCAGPLGCCSPMCPLGELLCLCGVLGHLAPVHRCAVWFVVWCVLCPGPLGSCSPVCPLGVLFCLCGVLGHYGPVHRCARSVCCFACAVSWATWLLFTGVPARCVVLLVRCPGPLGSCSPVCPLGVLPATAVSWATWLLFTGVPARCVACVCGVLGHLAPVHRCARSVRCLACAVSWATWLLFSGVPARCVGCVCGILGHLAPVHRCACSVCCLFVRYPGPLGSCSPLCPLGVLCCVCSVIGHLAPVHW